MILKVKTEIYPLACFELHSIFIESVTKSKKSEIGR
jgi:hypothetical protein